MVEVPLRRPDSEPYFHEVEDEEILHRTTPISQMSSMHISNLFNDSPPSAPYHDEMHRLSTFEDAMEGLDGTILARCGFFYESRYRIVECFSCHIRHRFTNREDVSLYRHLPSCAFANGQPTRNIPRQILNNRARTGASVDAARANASRIRSSRNRERASPRHVSSPARNLRSRQEEEPPRQRSPVREERPPSRGRRSRRDSGEYDNSPRERREESPRLRRTESPGEWRNANRNRDSGYPRNYDLRTRDERNRETQFPCLNPRHPHMRDVEDRVRTFSQGWRPFQTDCSPRDIAEAGLFYLGRNDETVCWYCGGGLENWEQRDNPWEEHAKWHPVCDYLLQKRGTDYVQRIHRQNSGMPRRSIPTTAGGSRNTTSQRRTTTSRRTTTTSTSQRTTRSTTRIGGATFQPSSPPPDVQVFPPVNWERSETRSPGGTVRTVYRSPDVLISMSSGEEPMFRTTNTYNIYAGDVGSERGGVSEALNSSIAEMVAQMGFPRVDIETVIRRRLNGVGSMYSTVTDMVDDLQSLETQRSNETARNQHGFSQVQSGPEVVFQGSQRRFENPCAICNARESNVVFTPCGHFINCSQCAERLEFCNRCGRDIENRVVARRE